MGTEYKDVLRVEGVEATIESSTLRNKQLGFGTDGQKRMVHKDASGNPFYWTADGYNVTYGNITIGEYLYHDGDVDTYLRFTDNSFELTAGAKSYIYNNPTGVLVLPEEVQIGEYVLPYTGGEINQVLGIQSGGGVGWIDQTGGGGGGITGTNTIGLTQYGGVALNLNNSAYTGTGEGLTIGQLVRGAYDFDGANSIDIAEVDSYFPIGAALQTIEFSTCGWVVTHGRAQVKFDSGGATKGYLFKISSITDGAAECIQPNEVAFNTLGVVLEDAGGDSLAWCIIK